MYNYWIALALDIVLIVFWIISPTLLLIDFTIKFYDYVSMPGSKKAWLLR